MSRTNKDEPLFVRATWWEPDHWACPYAVPRNPFMRYRRYCDLPAEPDPSGYDRTGRWRTRSTWRCRWEPAVTDERDHWPPRSVPKWYVDHVTHNPNRRRERDYGRRAIAEHRATGEVDADLPGFQHHHSGAWYW